jgi:hypothetical protein
VKHLKLLSLAVVAVALFALPAVAGAKQRDRDGDRMADRWERNHDLRVGKRDGRLDPDRDGLRNRGEFRNDSDPHAADTDDDGIEDGDEVESGNEPDDDDSDDDGTEDGDERAGTVASFDGTTLTIELFGGGSVSGLVTGDTEIECEDEGDDAPVASASDDDSGDDSSGEDSYGDDDPGDDSSGDDDSDESDEDSESDCSIAELVEGAVVHEAELELTSAGAVWHEVELAE